VSIQHRPFQAHCAASHSFERGVGRQGDPVVRSNRSAVAVMFLAPIMAVGSAAASAAQAQVVAWGRNDSGQCNVPVPPPGITYTEVSARGFYGVGLRSDGSIVAWGSNLFGQLNVPALPSGLTYIDISAGNDHVLARRSDGSAVAWGYNAFGQCTVSALPPGLSYVEVAAGYWHSLARRSDNSLVAWGQNTYGQCNVPALPPGLSYVELSAGNYHTLALRSDGSVVAWGRNSEGQCNVPALPAGIAYVEVSAGLNFSVSRRSDGAVVAWGSNDHGQCAVPVLPSGLSYLEVSAGGYHVVARRSDGSAIAWGWNNYGQLNVPSLPAGRVFTAVSAGEYHSVAMTDVASGGELGNYRFENGVAGAPASQSASILDSSHAGANGDPHGGPMWTDDVVAPSVNCTPDTLALAFDGIDDWVSFASPFVFHALSDATLEFWIKAPEQPHSPVFWSTDPAQGDTNRFHLSFSSGGIVGFDYRDPSSSLHTLLPLDGTYTIPVDAWTHIAITRVIEPNSEHTYRFYRNGLLVYVATDYVPNLPTASSWILARRDGTLQSTTWFHGVLDEIRLSGRALAPAEFGLAHYADSDGDGFGAGLPLSQCGPTDATNNLDCDDVDAAVHPGAVETCNYMDDDCNGQVDDGLAFVQYFIDSDGDGFGDCGGAPFNYYCSQPTGWVANSADYDDNCGSCFPGAPEVLDGKDNNFDGLVDEGFHSAYCIAGTTSHGCIPQMSYEHCTLGGCSLNPLEYGGTPNECYPNAHTIGGFVINATGVEGNRFGMLFYGLAPTATGWASGNSSVLCVAPPQQRMGSMPTGGTDGACDGVLSVDFNLWVYQHPSALGVPFGPGQQVFVQGWFRDPPSPGHTMLTDALKITIGP
jgi:alpha-tubulin suppressor-like RCC1 family protein